MGPVALENLDIPAKAVQYAGMRYSISGNGNAVHRILNERRWLDTYLRPR